MENKKITISLVASFLFATNIYATELSSITVTSATKSEQSIKDVTSSIEVITKEELEERNFTTLTEALNTVPGVSFKSHGSVGASTSVYLRGMDNNRTLVLIDGIRYQDPANTSGANLSHIMINDIERIEVIKGAQSGIWGADAAAGVINVITKKAKKGTHGSINLETGSLSTKKYGASISHGAEKFDAKLTVNKIETDGLSTVTPYGKDPKDFERDSYKNTSLSFDTNYYITDKSKLNISVKDINALAEYDNKDKPDDKSMKSDVDTTLYNVAFFQEINKHNINLKYQYSKFKRFEDGTTATPGFTWGGTFYPGSENVLIFDGQSHNIELSDEYKYMNDSFLLLGVGTTKEKVKFTMTDDEKKKKDSKGKFVYLTNSNKFNNFILTQSLRYDSYKNFDNETTGKVGVKYEFNSDLYITSNIGTGYNVPNILKEFNPWGTANFDLEPEETKSFDIGLNYKDFSFTFFKSKVDNLIDWKDGGYKNVEGESTFRGVEVAYEKALNDDILLNVNYTHLSAKDSDEERLLRRPKRKLNLALDYYGIKNLHFNVNAEYLGDRLDDKQTQTANYTLWNSVVNYQINNKLSTYLKIDNIFDKYYQTSLGYSAAPRSAYVGLRYNF